MSNFYLKMANDLKKAGANLGREGLSLAVIKAVDEFDGSYKGAMRLAGRLKAIAQAAKADDYWSEKVEDGYLFESEILASQADAMLKVREE